VVPVDLHWSIISWSCASSINSLHIKSSEGLWLFFKARLSSFCPSMIISALDSRWERWRSFTTFFTLSFCRLDIVSGAVSGMLGAVYGLWVMMATSFSVLEVNVSTVCAETLLPLATYTVLSPLSLDILPLVVEVSVHV
jgi:hypothetical protein